MPVFWLFLAMLVPTGLVVLMFTTAANSAIQLGSAPEVRGRVMGLYMLVFLGGAPLGSPLVGWVGRAVRRADEPAGRRGHLGGRGRGRRCCWPGRAASRRGTYLRPAVLARMVA